MWPHGEPSSTGRRCVCRLTHHTQAAAGAQVAFYKPKSEVLRRNQHSQHLDVGLPGLERGGDTRGCFSSMCGTLPRGHGELTHPCSALCLPVFSRSPGPSLVIRASDLRPLSLVSRAALLPSIPCCCDFCHFPLTAGQVSWDTPSSQPCWDFLGASWHSLWPDLLCGALWPLVCLWMRVIYRPPHRIGCEVFTGTGCVDSSLQLWTQ